MKRVLMVDDEEDLVWTTGRQIVRARPDLEFEGLTNPQEALGRIEASCPDLLITDIRMPQMSGLELLLSARKHNPRLPVIVVTAHGNPQVRNQAQHPDVQYMDKPFSFEALSAAIDRGLARPTGFSGAVLLPMLPDLIQLYAMSRMTGALRITRDSQAGALWFDLGEIVHAECDTASGAGAVYELLGWDGGTFSMDSATHAPCRSIDASWQELLMEGYRLLDERRRRPPAERSASAEDVRLAALAQRIWNETSAAAGDSSPSSFDVVLAAVGSAVVVVKGDANPSAWVGLIGELASLARQIAPGAADGSVEWIGPSTGAGLVWSDDAGIGLFVSGALTGSTAASRFRSSFARWSESARTALARGAR